LKILNLYAGIGGNRKLWEDVEVTAVEYNPEIAAIYQEYFPNDTVIVADAHEYLLQHYKEFDFIWASPPCQTHSRLRVSQKNRENFINYYPDMKLWQEIIFLQNFAVCPFVVENVIPYYDVFIAPTIEMQRHCFWSNIKLVVADVQEQEFDSMCNSSFEPYGFSVKNRKIKHRKDQIIRNLVNPEIGLAILDQVRGIKRKSKLKQISILDSD
jgi:DNA (cytosine-5)-methyltransferase 1